MDAEETLFGNQWLGSYSLRCRQQMTREPASASFSFFSLFGVEQRDRGHWIPPKEPPPLFFFHHWYIARQWRRQRADALTILAPFDCRHSRRPEAIKESKNPFSKPPQKPLSHPVRLLSVAYQHSRKGRTKRPSLVRLRSD